MTENIQGVYESSERKSFSDWVLDAQETPVNVEVSEYIWSVGCTKTEVDDIRKAFISVELISRYTLNDNVKLKVQITDLEKSHEKKIFEVDCTEIVPSKFWTEVTFDVSIQVYPNGYVTDFWATPGFFTDSTRPHDVVVNIGDEKFYLHKTYLATWSRYFDRLFFGEFKEKNQKEITIEEVDPEVFEKLMELIHPDLFTTIEDSNVLSLLKLADRFEIPSVMAQCGTYLKDFENCKNLSLIDRLELADSHNLAHLLITCLEQIHSMKAVDFKKFHDENWPRLRELSVNTQKNLV